LTLRARLQWRVARLCARRLGLDDATAHRLVVPMAQAVGPVSFWVRVAAFAVAAQPRLGRMLPERLRRRSVVVFAGRLLDSPAARNAYGADRTQLLAGPGAGLLRRP
jgi:hypothetical protein